MKNLCVMAKHMDQRPLHDKLFSVFQEIDSILT